MATLVCQAQMHEGESASRILRTTPDESTKSSKQLCKQPIHGADWEIMHTDGYDKLEGETARRRFGSRKRVSRDGQSGNEQTRVELEFELWSREHKRVEGHAVAFRFLYTVLSPSLNRLERRLLASQFCRAIGTRTVCGDAFCALRLRRNSVPCWLAEADKTSGNSIGFGVKRVFGIWQSQTCNLGWF